MPILENYTQFNGRHWETGTVANYFNYMGVNAPHTNQPYSEAFLLGVSGGAVMGYFSFAYEGYDPHARILTRNTFDPMETMLSRLGIIQNRMQTSKPEKGVHNLTETLANGVPVIVWADMFSLPYNALPFDEGMWGMMPIVVYGYDEAANQVWIADRAKVPLTITTEALASARGRVKKDKFRVLTLDPPNPDKLVTAVNLGIWDCIKLYTEKPPKGSKNNFGLQAYQWWAEQLTNPKARLSWAKEFPAGRKLYAGLTSVFTDINTFGKDGRAERDLYADFLEEAAILLENPTLNEAANHFRRSGQAWEALNLILLPDEFAPLAETRKLLLKQHRLFLEQGSAALDEIVQINDRLETIKVEMETNFPLDETGVVTLQEAIAKQVLHIREIEAEAVAVLKAAMN